MAWLLEKQGTTAAVQAAINAVTGANALETAMIAVASPAIISQMNTIGGSYFYVYYAGTYQVQTAARLTIIVCPIKGVQADGSFPLNVPPQGN